MKSHKFFSIITFSVMLIATTIAFVSCKKHEEGETGNEGKEEIEEITSSIVGSWFNYDTSDPEEMCYYGTLIVLDRNGRAEFSWSEGCYFEQYSGK